MTVEQAGLLAAARRPRRAGQASGCGRAELDIPATLRAIGEASPYALTFGTDLPSTRAPRPFTPADLETSATPLTPTTPGALYDNARAWYRLDPQEHLNR